MDRFSRKLFGLALATLVVAIILGALVQGDIGVPAGEAHAAADGEVIVEMVGCDFHLRKFVLHREQRSFL